MRSKGIFGFLLLSTTIALVAGCGEDTSKTCGPQSCAAGCCDVQGQCQNGTTNNACGSGGGLCSACPIGAYCISGKCTSCDQNTCPTGCCQGDQCMPGNTSSACGRGGLSCLVCKGGESCVDGQCSTTGPCDPISCSTGCCQGGQCLPGTAQDACGTGGLACVPCLTDQLCVEGECGLGTCDVNTCANGCCDGNKCEPGNTNAACGTGGTACTVCTDPDQCVNQACGTSPCSQSTCTGCCDSQGTCQKGDTRQECGTNGKVCKSCPGSLSCVNGNCAWDPQAKWKVTVVSATIQPPPMGKIWDQGALPGFVEPDVYIEVSCAGINGKTGTKDNTYTPAFNDEVITATAQQLGGGVNIQVYDEDPIPPNELMGVCNSSFAKVNLEQGSFTVFNCGTPNVQNILFSFAMQ